MDSHLRETARGEGAAKGADADTDVFPASV